MSVIAARTTKAPTGRLAGGNGRGRSFRRPLAVSLLSCLSLAAVPCVYADTYPPDWSGGTGAAVHFAPAAWPSEPADPKTCGLDCGDWKPYTRFQNDIADPRTQDPSNGGTAPQNYVNVSSSCVDKSFPSIYYYLRQGAVPADDVIFFRWRVEQIANNYGTGPSAGNYGATDPWSSALWSVLFDVNGDGYIDLAAHLDGSSGKPAEPIDRIAGVWSKLPTQSLDYLGDPLNVKLIAHNPTAFTSGGTILNFHDTLAPDTTWPAGGIQWDYGTTRAKMVVTSPCNEYFVDYQIPIRMLNASSGGPNPALDGPAISRSTPIAMLFCTANSLNNPFQKDCVINKAWVGSTGKPAPFGDYLSFDQTDPYAQPIVSSVTATAPTGCPGSYQLSAKVQDVLAVQGGAVVPSVRAVDFFYYYDADGDGLANDGGDWTRTGAGALAAGSLNTWNAAWDATGLPKGKYLVGVQAVDDNTKLDDGMTPTGVDNRTFSYVVGDPENRIYVGGTSYASFPAHSPSMTPGTSEDWYGNPSVTGTQTALIGVALNNCGKEPTLTKTASADSVVAGGTVDFTLTLTNQLLSPITVGQVVDTLPPGFSYLAGNTSGTGVLAGVGEPASAGQTPTWNFGPALSLPAGASASLTFRATASSTSGSYSNTSAAATSFGTLTSTPVSVAVDAARLSLTKTPSLYRINPDGSTLLTYTLAYANDSTVTVNAASITDPLPAGATYVACTGGTSCSNTAGTVTWQLGTLAGGYAGSVTLTVTVDTSYSTATLANTATFSATAPDASTVSKAASSTVGVNIPLPAFTLTKSAGAVQTAPSGSVTWTISYDNYGTGPASGVVIADTLPAGFTYSSCTGGGSCSGSGGSASWSIGTVAAGGSGTVTVTATAAAAPFTYPNPATNSATITWAGNGTGVTSTASVGVSGQYCSAVYYFHRGADNSLPTIRPATISPPSGSTDYITTVTGLVGNAYNTTNQIIFESPAAAGTTDLSGKTLTVDFYLSTTTGGTDVRVILEKSDGATTTALATSADIAISNASAWKTFTAVLGSPVALNSGELLRWRFQFKGAGGKNISFYYDSTTYNSRSSFCTATAPAALSLSKTVDQSDIASASGTLNYVLAYANPGGASATGASLVDTLPANVSCSRYSSSCTDWSDSTTCSGWTPCSGASLTLSPGGGTLTAGASGKYLVQATVGAGASGTLTNSATLSATGLTPATATAATSVGGAGTPSLAIAKSASSTLVAAGDTVTYTLTVVNTGSATATDVVATDNFPDTAYFTYQGCSTAQGSCGESPSGTLSWNVGTLAVGGSATLTFAMGAAAAGLPAGVTTLDNAASATGPGMGTVNSGTVTVSLSGNPVLTLTKSATPTTGLAPGDTIAYTIVVGNTGSAAANGVTVTDPVPANTGFSGNITASAGSGSFDAVGNRVVFAVGTLAAGASATLAFDVVVGSLPSGATMVVNTATASAANAASRSAGASAAASASPTLALSKTGPTQVAYPGATLTAAAAASTILAVNSSAQVAEGQLVSIGGTVVGVETRTSNSITVDGAVTAASGTPVVGAITYSLSYQNTGDATAVGATLVDTLPAGALFISASGGGSHAGGAVTWTIGDLAPGEGGSVQVVIVPAASGTLSNGASFDCPSCTPANDSLQTSVGGLVVTKTTSTPTAFGPGAATYSIEIANTLGSAASDVSVTDTLPAGFAYDTTVSILVDGSPVAATTSPLSGDQTLTWSSFSIPAGKKLLLTYAATIASSVGPATYQNDAGASSSNGGVIPFDPLSTTGEDVTVLAASTGLLEGHIYLRQDSNATYDAGTDTPYGSVEVTIEQTAGDCGIPGSATCYIVYTDADGYYARVLPAGIWVVTAVSGTGDLPASGPILVVGVNPETLTVPDQGVVNHDCGFSLAVNADLSISKTDGFASVSAGGSVSYSVVVSNAGPSAADGALLKDAAAAGLSKTGTPTCDSATGGAVCPGTLTNALLEGAGVAIPTLPAGGSVTFTITADLTVTGGSVSNTATVTAPAGTTDPDATNDSATDTDAVSPVADLVVAKTADKMSVVPGDTVDFTLTVRNDGPSNATGVRVFDRMPTSLAHVSDTSGGSYDPVTGIWDIGALPLGTFVTLSITATVQAPGLIQNIARVSSDLPDPEQGNNSSALLLNAGSPVADLAVTKAASAPAAGIGEAVTFTVTVTNNGPDPATGVQLRDLLPTDLIFETASVLQGSYDPATGYWDLGNLDAGSQVALQMTAMVTNSGQIVNEVAVTGSDQIDPDLTNNYSTAVINQTQTAVADLAVQKTVSQGAVTLGDPAVFTVVVRNNGPDTATGVVVHDALPAALAFISAAASQGTFDPATGDWAAGTIAAFAHAVLEVTVAVNSYEPQTNTAAVSTADVLDPVPANNTGSATVVATLLTFQKTASPLIFDHLGQIITYRLVARNDSLLALDSVGIADPLLDVLSCTPPQPSSLAPGEELACTGTYAITQEDMDAGAVHNTASATGAALGGQVAITTAARATVAGARAAIAPATTTCGEFAGGSAAAVGDVRYTLAGGRISAVDPEFFRHYTAIVAPARKFRISIRESKSRARWPYLPPHTYCDIVIWDADCTSITTRHTAIYNPTVGVTNIRVTNAEAGKTYYLDILFKPRRLVGTAAKNKQGCVYSFTTFRNGVVVNQGVDSISVLPDE